MKLALLMLLWFVLATIIIVQLANQGVDLYYPVVVAWLGGLVSIELVRELAVYIKEER